MTFLFSIIEEVMKIKKLSYLPRPPYQYARGAGVE